MRELQDEKEIAAEVQVPAAISLSEEFMHGFWGTGNDCTVSENTHGAIHDFGMFYEQADECIGGIVVIYVASQVFERTGVNQVFGFTGQECEKFSQVLFVQRCFHIFNHVELDVDGAQNIHCAIGFASVGVVVDGDF